MSHPAAPIRRLLQKLSEARLQDRERLRTALARIARLPAEERAAEISRLERLLAASIADRRLRAAAGCPELRYPPELPITAFREEIVSAIRRHRVVIVCGETGSGKSTQLPKFCLEAGRGMEGRIGHTQPRRIAAQAVARRIAEELGEELGRTVGFKIRFHEQTSPETRIQVMTDGILLAEAAGDRSLSAYDTLIVDEAHERSLNIDFLLGYLRLLLKRRRDLKAVITSATLDTEAFVRAFEGAPVIRVAGRTFPVEVRYAPPEAGPGEEEPTPVEQAVAAVCRIAAGGEPGDVLVFLPTEQDIREAAAALAAERLPRLRVLPLFARLSAEEQHRVFRPAPGRKVVLATNVAETSLTIPGIRFVVDTGLARIPRYLPRTRTTAMPVVPVSRGSAVQRAGRCGRTQGGVCIRLYAEEDFLARPLHTPPEIRRSNLAEVVLRLLALGLGPIEAFPFLDPPDPRGVADGVRLLAELGAVEEAPEGVRLTSLGKTLARIPLDPRLSRMLVAGREEGCFEETAVIAAALSIRDPRERPAEKAAEADRAHAAFHRGGSDFLTLLALWEAWQQARRARPAAAALREFCRGNALSFRRMREWEDVTRQILEAARESGLRPAHGAPGEVRDRSGEAEFAGRLHRAVLAGFLSHIAVRKEKHLYRTARGREAMIFPGSAAFGTGAEWIVAAELVETTRLYARTAAGIDPAWLERLGGGLCRRSWRDPRFDPRRGEVTATEQVTLFGLVIVPGRPVSLSRIDPQAASEVFCREALGQGRIGRRFSFLEHNRALLAYVEGLEHRLRRRDLRVGEEDLVRFYRERLGGVASVRDLERAIRERGEDGFLRLAPEDVMTFRPEGDLEALYPDRVEVAGRTLALSYRYEPGGPEDGVTLAVPASFAGAVPLELLDWLVPGWLPEKIEALLKSLPKAQRKALLPLSATRDLILREMPRGEGPLAEALSGFLRRRLKVEIPASAWSPAALPEHLRPRIAIFAADGRELASGRDPALLRAHAAPGGIPAAVRRRYERRNLERWDFGDLPAVLTGAGPDRVPWAAFPALAADAGGGVNLVLFSRREAAEAAHPTGVAALAARQARREIVFLRRALRIGDETPRVATRLRGAARLEGLLAERVIRDLFAVPVRRQREFEELLAARLPGLQTEGQRLREAALAVFAAGEAAVREMAALAGLRGPAAAIAQGLEAELERLLPRNFPAGIPRTRFADLARLLRALAVRIRRAAVDPEKERLRAREAAAWVERWEELRRRAGPRPSPAKEALLAELFWMIEEYKVSLFAQEMKTAFPVSPKRLEAKVREIEETP